MTCMGGRGGKKYTDQGPLWKSLGSGLCCLALLGILGLHGDGQHNGACWGCAGVAWGL